MSLRFYFAKDSGCTLHVYCENVNKDEANSNELICAAYEISRQWNLG